MKIKMKMKAVARKGSARYRSTRDQLRHSEVSTAVSPSDSQFPSPCCVVFVLVGLSMRRCSFGHTAVPSLLPAVPHPLI